MSSQASLDPPSEGKDIIHDLYMTKRWELERVREHMRTQHGFVKSKSWYTKQLRKWGFLKHLKDATVDQCRIASYKVTKARKAGKNVDLYFREQLITPRVLRGERFFLSRIDEAEIDTLNPPPSTPPGFKLINPIQAMPPISPRIESHGEPTIESLQLSAALIRRTPSPLQRSIQLNNLPWFEFQVQYRLLTETTVGYHGRTPTHRLSTNHQLGVSAPSYSSAVDMLGFYFSIQEELTTVGYPLDLFGEQQARELRDILQLRLGSIVDESFIGWGADLLTFAPTKTTLSSLTSFIPERVDGELREGVDKILAPSPTGPLEFLSYIINLISNNHLSESEITRFARYIGEIRDEQLLDRLLALQGPTIRAFASNLFLGALKLGNAALTETLLKAGVDPNMCIGYGRIYPLSYAARHGTAEIVQLLLNFGACASLNVPVYECSPPIVEAVLAGKVETVRLLLTAGADVNASAADNYGYTALQAAASTGSVDLTQILLDAGADINAPAADDYGYTVLQAAAMGGYIDLSQLLLDAGADINAPAEKKRGRTALQAAAEGGNIELVQVLLNAGADVNAPAAESGGYTALQAAAMEGYIGLTQLLLDAGADVNASAADNYGYTALRAAASTGSVDLTQILLDAGADVNAPAGEKRGRTALQAAAAGGHIELVQVLLNAGADVNAPAGKEFGYTALQAAAEGGHIELVQVLLNAGADVNADGAKEGYTALQEGVRSGNIQLVHILLNAGADLACLASPIAANSESTTPLQFAASRGNIDMVRILLEAGMDVDAPPKNRWGRNALQAAAESGSVDLVRLLLDAGANVNALPAYRCGVTALQAASIKGNLRIAQLLLDAGANVNAAPAIEEGRTALEGAAEHGRLDMLQLLINAGADLTQCSRAIELAVENGHDAIRQLLDRYRSEAG